MRVRFDIPEAPAAEREDGMTVRYAPATRPRRRLGARHLLIAVLLVLLVAIVLAAVGASICR